MTVRAYLDLGGLTPEDVEVQTVTGRVDVNEQLHDITTVHMDFVGDRRRRLPVRGAAAADHGPARSATRCGCCRSNDLLASPAEMGLVTTA